MPSYLFCSIVACTTFSSKDNTVVSPTPPGTGVILSQTSNTFSVSTSPSIFPSTLLIPTSITTAFSFTISAVTKFDFPMADIRISAFFDISFKFLVFEWQVVTVAFLFKQQCINGFPTILLLPNITTFFPHKSILYSSNEFPKCEKLFIEVNKIRLNSQEIVEGNWKIELNIADKFNEREKIIYEPSYNEHIIQSEIYLTETT